jgi:hypothetical protein
VYQTNATKLRSNTDIYTHDNTQNNTKIRGEFILQGKGDNPDPPAMTEKSYDTNDEEEEELSSFGNHVDSSSIEDPESYARTQMRKRLEMLRRCSDSPQSPDNIRASAPPMSIHYYKPVALRRFTYLPGNELQYSLKKQSSNEKETTHL